MGLVGFREVAFDLIRGLIGDFSEFFLVGEFGDVLRVHF